VGEGAVCVAEDGTALFTHAESKPLCLLGRTPARFIDYAWAPDQETAEQQAAEAHEIREPLRRRLFAIREDW
jgi:hypothetical protein